jgi:hypothetical protein
MATIIHVASDGHIDYMFTLDRASTHIVHALASSKSINYLACFKEIPTITHIHGTHMCISPPS